MHFGCLLQSSSILFIYLGQGLSRNLELTHLARAASPRDAPVSPSPALGLQTHSLALG